MIDRKCKCTSMLLRNACLRFLHQIITCDEKWVLYDNRKRSSQWVDENIPPGHTPKPKFHQTKLLSPYGGIMPKKLFIHSIAQSTILLHDNHNHIKFQLLLTN